MKIIHTEFWVEHEFEETRFGNRPNLINIFATREEAEKFLATTKDGKVVEAKLTEHLN